MIEICVQSGLSLHKLTLVQPAFLTCTESSMRAQQPARKRRQAARGEQLTKKQHYMAMAMKFTRLAVDEEPQKARIIHRQIKQYFKSMGVEKAGDCYVGGCIAVWADVDGLPPASVVKLAQQLQKAAGGCAWLQLPDGACFQCEQGKGVGS